MGDLLHDSSSDQHLIAVIASQTAQAPTALSMLYQRYSGLLLGLALRIVRNMGEAEDLVHDVFLEAWKNAGGFDPDRGSVRTWLTVRMRSRAIDVLKSSRVARNAGDAIPLGLSDTVEVSDIYAHGRLRECLESLSRDHRAALELAYFEGLSCAEIASREGIPVGTVKSRTAHALAKLRTFFAKEEP